MSDLTFLERRQLERLFRMGGGYVLDFSDRSFAEFFADVVAVDIGDAQYRVGSGSKANRLRGFWQIAENHLVGKVLSALAEVAEKDGSTSPEIESDLRACRAIADRLLGSGVDTEVRGTAVHPQPLANRMYHLIVSGQAGSLDGRPFLLERARCLTFTDADITGRFGSLSDEDCSALLELPCIFAYEPIVGEPPRYGRLTRIAPRQGEVRLEYEFLPVSEFLGLAAYESLRTALGITQNFELHHTHWAIKEVDLRAVLAKQGIAVPPAHAPTVSLQTHRFDVALSFSGEARNYVEAVTKELDREIGRDKYFYDNHYKAQLARPALDGLLEDIYRNRSRLIVVFVGGDYQEKKWCGLEFRVVREIVFDRHHERVMYVRMDDQQVAGVLATDGYVDARTHTPAEIARMIKERVL